MLLPSYFIAVQHGLEEFRRSAKGCLLELAQGVRQIDQPKLCAILEHSERANNQQVAAGRFNPCIPIIQSQKIRLQLQGEGDSFTFTRVEGRMPYFQRPEDRSSVQKDRLGGFPTGDSRETAGGRAPPRDRRGVSTATASLGQIGSRPARDPSGT